MALQNEDAELSPDRLGYVLLGTAAQDLELFAAKSESVAHRMVSDSSSCLRTRMDDVIWGCA